MKSLSISGYTFSTTSVPTSPALRVESGTGTYYVNLTTGQRPEALSDQKVFTISTTNYSFLRPFVTSNSLMGYSGVSNNSTLTTGYSGVSNNSTVTTGYAGVSNNSTVTTMYIGFSNNSTITTMYIGVSNNSTITTGYSGVSNNSTVTTGYSGVSITSSVDSKWYSIFSVGSYKQSGISTYTYDERFISKAVFGYTNTKETRINPDIECYKPQYATYSTSYTSFVNIPDGYGSMQFNNKGYGGNTYLVGTNVGHTYSTSPEVYHGGPIGYFSGDFEIRSYASGVIFYTIRYKMTHTYSAVMALGWVYKGGTMPLRSSGYRPYTPWAMSTETVGTISFWEKNNQTFTVDNRTYSLRPIEVFGLTDSGRIISSSTAVGNLSNTTALTRTTTRYSSSVAVGNLSNVTNLTRTTTRFSSSVAVGNLSSTTALTNTTKRLVSCVYSENLSSTTALTRTATRYSSSVAVGNLSSATALTNTATRYSSSTAKGYLSSITNLTRTATRYSSSVAVGNLSNTTEVRTITRL